ncbi:MAG: sigma-54-dependent Fis family transcriptional regulator, partial [Candidatus Cloacimonetes bacterium]|nr:sigma-54-dependent Fis family transcriptional regulator [Candidatus Cloacimonadota bacterium]
MNQLSILVVDDEKGYRDELFEYLTDCDFSVNTAGLPLEALSVIQEGGIDIVILDLKLPQMSGIELLKKIMIHDSEIAVIMISGHGDMDSVIESMREGAVDFISKPFDLDDVRLSIERTKKHIELQARLNSVQTTCQTLMDAMDKSNRCRLIGESAEIKQLVHLMKQVSESNSDVLITGESGTGKELVARGIYNLSRDCNRILFDVNCTAIPENLFESEFFGHTRNAFTGAVSEKKGWFEVANGGTLFLDEIGDMPLNMQAKLLRVLEERKMRKVGSAVDIPLNIRIIASTNKNIRDLMERKLFREDLYYRL